MESLTNSKVRRCLTKNKLVYGMLSVMVFLSLFSGGIQSQADNTKDSVSQEAQLKKKDFGQTNNQNNKDSEMGFSISPVRPSTQVDQTKGYYYLEVRPGEKQTLTLKVRSIRKEAVDVDIYVKDGFTNTGGNMDYDGHDYTRDKTLKNSIEDITTVSAKKVTVANFEEKEVTIDVTPPSKPFKGVKAGAVCAMKADSKKKGKGLSTKLGYRLGLIITEEPDQPSDGSATLNLLGVEADVTRGRRVIQTKLQNPEPKIMKNVTVSTKLRRKGDPEVLRSRKVNNMKMAPNSQFDFLTDWGIDPIKPGKYEMTIHATSNEHSWKWTKTFTIGDKKAAKINENASYTVMYPKWVPLVVLLLGVAMVANIGCLYIRRKKWGK